MRRAFSTSVFARHAGEILLIHHNRLQQWLPVGGEFAPGETPLECAQRELREETGLTGSFSPLGGVDGTPPGLLAYEEHLSGSKGTHLNFCFVADVAHRDIEANDEFSQHRWVSTPPAECPLNVRQLVQLALEHQSIWPPAAVRAGTARTDVLARIALRRGSATPRSLPAACAAPGRTIANLATASKLIGALANAAGLAERWISAFNRHAVEDLLQLYADDAVHITPKLRAQSPGSDGALRGKDALRAWWSGALQRNPGLRYTLNHATSAGKRVWMHYARVNPGEATYPVAELLEVNDAGRICRSEVFHG